jgi:hypothetical protein
MRSEEAQTARRHLPIYFLSRKKVSKKRVKIRRSETTVSEGRRRLWRTLHHRPRRSSEFAVPFLWGWWLLFFLSLFRLYKYRCDYHHKKKKKNLFRCHYHSQSLIIHGVIPPRRTRVAHNSLSKPNGATKPEVSDRFRPIPSFTLKTFGDSTLYLSNSFAFDGISWRCYWSYLKKTKN